MMKMVCSNWYDDSEFVVKEDRGVRESHDGRDARACE